MEAVSSQQQQRKLNGKKMFIHIICGYERVALSKSLAWEG